MFAAGSLPVDTSTPEIVSVVKVAPSARRHAGEHRLIGRVAQHPGREADHEHVSGRLCRPARPCARRRSTRLAERARAWANCAAKVASSAGSSGVSCVRGRDLEPDRRIGLSRRTGGRRRRARRRCGGRGDGGRRARRRHRDRGRARGDGRRRRTGRDGQPEQDDRKSARRPRSDRSGRWGHLAYSTARVSRITVTLIWPG